MHPIACQACYWSVQKCAGPGSAQSALQNALTNLNADAILKMKLLIVLYGNVICTMFEEFKVYATVNKFLRYSKSDKILKYFLMYLFQKLTNIAV